MDLIESYTISKRLASMVDSELSKSLVGHEFNRVHVEYILALGRHEGISIKDICVMNGLDKGQATRVVRKLIEMGAVVNLGDKKKYALYLTPVGKLVQSYGAMVLLRIKEKIFAEFTEEEAERFCKMLEKLDETLRANYEY